MLAKHFALLSQQYGIIEQSPEKEKNELEIFCRTQPEPRLSGCETDMNQAEPDPSSEVD